MDRYMLSFYQVIMAYKPETALEQSHGTCFRGAALRFGRRGRAHAVPYVCTCAGVHKVAHGACSLTPCNVCECVLSPRVPEANHTSAYQL